MHPAGVHEHGGEQRRQVARGIGQEAPGHEGPAQNERLATAHLHQEEEDIERDQDIGHDRRNAAAGIVVSDGKHGVLGLYARVRWLTGPADPAGAGT